VSREALLWRRLPTVFFVDDGEGGKRLSSKAFQDNHTSVSVAGEITHELLLRGFEKQGIAELPASVPYDLALSVVRFREPHNLAHAQIEGKATGGKKNRMVNGCVILRLPDDL